MLFGSTPCGLKPAKKDQLMHHLQSVSVPAELIFPVPPTAPSSIRRNNSSAAPFRGKTKKTVQNNLKNQAKLYNVM